MSERFEELIPIAQRAKRVDEPCLPSARHHLSGRWAKRESERLINETGISPLRDGVKEVTLRNFHDRQDPSLATSRRSENNCSNTVNRKKKKIQFKSSKNVSPEENSLKKSKKAR